MDKRQQKTRQAIFNALTTLLEGKHYEAITVQEIIDEANIGRSTFYAHFETKDELLRSMCMDIFNHVFQVDHGHHPEMSSGLEQKLSHVLYHLREDNEKLRGILKGGSSHVFMGYFKEYLRVLFEKYLDEFDTTVPESFLMHHLVGSFSETVRWWIDEDTQHSPEQVAHYFMQVLHMPKVS